MLQFHLPFVSSHLRLPWQQLMPPWGRPQRPGRLQYSWRGFQTGWRVWAGRPGGPGSSQCSPSMDPQLATEGSAGYTRPGCVTLCAQTLCSSHLWTSPAPGEKWGKLIYIIYCRVMQDHNSSKGVGGQQYRLKGQKAEDDELEREEGNVLWKWG